MCVCVCAQSSLCEEVSIIISIFPSTSFSYMHLDNALFHLVSGFVVRYKDLLLYCYCKSYLFLFPSDYSFVLVCVTLL